MKDYIIVNAIKDTSLAAKVNEKLHAGWRLVGGVSVIPGSLGEYILIQAMAREM